ncbi:acyl dehydratase [Geodermatophilaceae bacterium NBWT11]|nr:acyl dehydratase [Geodermatophilaceae bacterium NBWT11]
MRYVDGLPVPVPTPVSAPYWAALREHRVRIQYSPSSGQWVFYPRLLAPGTLADDLEWREISGAGHLYSFTVATRATAPPWAGRSPQHLAIVELAEGPRLTTELVDVEGTDLHIGMSLDPVFVDVPGADVTLLKYRPSRQPAT